mgnify:CR=1 FL=1
MSVTNEELLAKLEALQLQADRAEAVAICANIMSRYVNYHAAFRHKEYVEFWAKRDDDILEMPWGKYYGFEGVKSCYLDHHKDRNDVEDESQIAGAYFIHHLDTPVIEVAADGKTARGAWWSPGHETFPRHDGLPGQAAIWAWSKYGADFIKEEDGWKIWRMRIYPMFKTPVGTSWTECTEFSGPMNLDEFPKTDGPCTDTPWYMGPNMPYPADQPDPPVPYGSYSDLKKTFFGDMMTPPTAEKKD